MILRALLALLLLAALPAAATEQIVTGLSQNRVQITANFDGSEILIYGAVKRDAPLPEDSRLDVIITVEGPQTPLVIRRKERVAGIWLNRSEVTVDSAPEFYAIATNGPLEEILTETDDLRHHISIPLAIRAVGISQEAAESELFTEALARIRIAEDRFRLALNSVQLIEQTLFRTDVALPANLTDGKYVVRLFILREGHVIDSQERVIDVRKAGLERLLFNLAHERPFLYGVLSLIMAAVAGWGASAAFRFVRT